jgi:hypothetical protein
MSLAIGDEVTVKDNDYGYFQLRKFLEKGAHGRKCQLVEVIHSTDRDFTFGLIKTFRLVDVKKAKP